MTHDRDAIPDDDDGLDDPILGRPMPPLAIEVREGPFDLGGDLVRLINGGPATFDLALEMAAKRERPFDLDPTIDLDKLHAACSAASASPGSIGSAYSRGFSRMKPWTWFGPLPDVVRVTVYEKDVGPTKIVQVVVSSQSTDPAVSFVNIVAALRAAGSSPDETLRSSQTYRNDYFSGAARLHFAGVAAIPGSRASV